MPVHSTVTIADTEIFCRRSGKGNGRAVLLFHGKRFSSQNWEELNTLDFLASKGFDAIAVDLPGYGQSPEADIAITEILPEILDALKLDAPIIVAPSFSGLYTLPVIAEKPGAFSGCVAAAPLGVPENAEALEGCKVPFLIIWGDDDPIVPVENAELLSDVVDRSEALILAGGGHPTYINCTGEFHSRMLEFIEGLA